MQASSCNNCGAPIIWAKKKENGRWNRPLDGMSGINGIVLVGDEVHMGTVYQPHLCKNNNVARLINQKRMEDAAQAEMAEDQALLPVPEVPTFLDDEKAKRSQRIREVQEAYDVDVKAWENPETVAAREERRIAKHKEFADKKRCPYCKAKKGELCWNVTEKVRGHDIRARAAHGERTGDLFAENYRTPRY